MPIIIEPEDSRFDAPYIADFKSYIHLKRQIDDLKKLQDAAKGRLMKLVEEFGEEDDKGHMWFDLPEEFEGYKGMQRQKRISQKPDIDVAQELLEERGLADKCIEMVPALNEDAIMAAYYEGLLDETDIDRMYPKTVTWAFVPVKS